MTISAKTKQDTLLGQMVVNHGFATKSEFDECVDGQRPAEREFEPRGG